MEAKDTVMDLTGLTVGEVGVANQQAEISFTIGYGLGHTDGSYKGEEDGKQAGIREVVEIIDKTGLIGEHTDSPLHETGATIIDCPACCWYAYKKEWGIAT